MTNCLYFYQSIVYNIYIRRNRLMNNEDLQRLYNIGVDRELPGDFVRRDKNGKIPGAGDEGKYLQYKGDWSTGKDYSLNNAVTWTDGHLYQVIKAHTSSATIDPSNTEYYKAMTASKYYSKSYNVNNSESRSSLISDVTGAIHKHRRALCYLGSIDSDYKICLEFNEEKNSSFYGVVGTGFHQEKPDYFPAIVQYFITTEVYELSKTVLSSTGATKTVLTGSTSITIYYEA